MNWQPIETAPKDGRRILTYNGIGGGYNGVIGQGEEKGDIAVANYLIDPMEREGRWYLPHCCDGVSYNEPTHWMPLPNPPDDALPLVKEGEQ